MHMIRTFFAVGLAGGAFNALAVAQTADMVEAHVDNLYLRPARQATSG